MGKDGYDGGKGGWNAPAGGTREKYNPANPSMPPPQKGDTATCHLCRVRGLPWNTVAEEVQAFFAPLAFASANPVTLVPSTQPGRSTGEAFIAFDSMDTAQRALSYDRKEIGSRYVEVFPANQEDLMLVLQCIEEGPQSDSEKDMYAMKINQLRKHSEEAKARWMEACDARAPNMHDPNRHPKSFLKEFFDAHSGLMPGGGSSGMPDHGYGGGAARGGGSFDVYSAGKDEL